MNKEKNPVQLLKELDSLLTAKKNLINTEEINGIIAETAEEFMASINADLDDELQEDSTPSATPKSEMPCNCHKEKVEFKPCPFCGNKDLEIIPAGSGDNESMSMYPRIYCSGCQTMFKKMVDCSPEYLVDCWNTRNVEVAKADSNPSLQEKIIQAVTDSVKKNLPPDTRVVVFID